MTLISHICVLNDMYDTQKVETVTILTERYSTRVSEVLVYYVQEASFNNDITKMVGHVMNVASEIH